MSYVEAARAAVVATLTLAFTSKPLATLSTYALVAASWALDGSVTFVILLESTSTTPEPFGLIFKSIFVSLPVVAICTALPVAAFVISNSFTALVVVCKRINSLPLASAI